MIVRFEIGQLQRQLDGIGRQLQTDLEKEVDRALHKGAEKIASRASELAPVHLGLLRRVLVTPAHSDRQIRYLIRSSAPYAAAIEFGSRPFFPPIDSLKSWAASKLGDEKLAFVVARSIARKGIRPQPFMMPAYYQFERQIQADVKAAIRKVARG